MQHLNFVAEGCDSAWQCSRVFGRNLRDLVAKVDDGSSPAYERGFLHTSTEPAPGTNYYRDVWSRDGGRGLIELACLGYTDLALDVASYFARHLNAGDHWSRTIQNPPTGGATYELDGNALALLGLYHAWRVKGRQMQHAELLLPTALKVVGWARDRMDESPCDDLLPCVSEMVMIVLLKVVWTWATPTGMFFLTFFFPF